MADLINRASILGKYKAKRKYYEKVGRRMPVESLLKIIIDEKSFVYGDE